MSRGRPSSRIKKENSYLSKDSLQLQAFIEIIMRREDNGEENAYNKAKGSRERI